MNSGMIALLLLLLTIGGGLSLIWAGENKNASVPEEHLSEEQAEF